VEHFLAASATGTVVLGQVAGVEGVEQSQVVGLNTAFKTVKHLFWATSTAMFFGAGHQGISVQEQVTLSKIKEPTALPVEHLVYASEILRLSGAGHKAELAGV